MTNRCNWLITSTLTVLIYVGGAFQFDCVAAAATIPGESASAPEIRLNERVIAIPGTPVLVATWNEMVEDGPPTAYFSISRNGVGFGPSVQISNRIHLRFADFEPLQELPQPPVGLASENSLNRLFLVQFISQPLAEYRDQLATLGARTVKYMPDNAYLVDIPSTAIAALQALPFVRWVGAYHVAYKLDEQLIAEHAAGGLAPVRAYSLWLSQRGAAAQDPVSAEIQQLGGGGIVRTSGMRMEATLTFAQMLAVARLNEVLWIDLVTERSTDMDIMHTLWGANYIEGIGGWDGGGVRGEVMDGGVLATHVDFQLHPIMLHLPNNADNSHGTCTTGIVFGTGTGNPQGRGMLPDAQPVFSSYYSLTDRFTETADLVDPNKPYRCVFQSNSWGDAQTTQYTSISADMDDLLFANDIVVLQSQSNTGNQTSRPQAWAKNIVSIGGISHFNDTNTTNDSWQGASIGPASDGRIKPELCNAYDSIFCPATPANNSYTSGFNGTSAATPICAGHFGLWFDMWADGVFGNPTTSGDVFDERPHMTTSKAAMINLASRYPFTQNGITRYQQGYGVPNLKTLYDNRDKFFYVDETDVLSEGQSTVYQFSVPSGTPFFRATMIYADPAGNPAASKQRINDFDLKVTAPDGTTIYWGNNGLITANVSAAGGSPNSTDTVENVFIDNPASGLWLVEVIARSIVEDGHVETPGVDGDYALVVTGVPSVPPALKVNLISGPSGLTPKGVPPVVQALIQDGTETVVPGSETLYYRYGVTGGFAAISLTNLGGGNYSATLPAANCDDHPQYYLSALGSGGTTVTSPGSAPTSAHSFTIGAIGTIFSDDFESNQGWTAGVAGDTATAGVWQRAAPALTTAQPDADHSASGTLCFVTDALGGAANDHDVDGGFTTLLSPAFNMAGAGTASISYWRWFYNSNIQNSTLHRDVFKVDISNDNGANWVNAETIGPSGPEVSGGWFQHSITVSSFVAPTATVRLRFVAADAGVASTIEALIDDVTATGMVCATHPGDLNGDGVVDLGDLSILLANYGITVGGTHDQGDLNGDGMIDLGDLALILGYYGV